MTAKKTEPWYVTSREQLLAEKFVLELEPLHVSSLRQSDVGLDYMLFFSRKNGALQALGVKVEATQKELQDRWEVDSSLLEQLADSNLPVLLVVIDVKRNDILFNWVEEIAAADSAGRWRGVAKTPGQVPQIESRRDRETETRNPRVVTRIKRTPCCGISGLRRVAAGWHLRAGRAGSVRRVLVAEPRGRAQAGVAAWTASRRLRWAQVSARCSKPRSRRTARWGATIPPCCVGSASWSGWPSTTG